MYKLDCNIPEYMNSAAFWVNAATDADKIILFPEAINTFNHKISKKIQALIPLDDSLGYIDSHKLSNMINNYTLPKKQMYYDNGIPTDAKFYENILINRNLEGVLEKNPITYGITFKKTSMRSFPTDIAVYSSLEHANMSNFDRFQETGYEPCEMLMLLHLSKDKQWFFAKAYNYFGWVKAEDIAVCEDKTELLNYLQPKHFLTVTAKHLCLDINIDQYDSISYGMGTKLYLSNPSALEEDCYNVKIPLRSMEGLLYFKEVLLKKSSSVIDGFLPYTRANILKQAFKFLDIGYDWGTKNSGQDCSGFILAVYKCFGFSLPRNADEQELSFVEDKNSITFAQNDNLDARNNKFEGLKPGTAIFKDGHVMMYLGKHENTHYMIHSFAEYGVLLADNTIESRSAMLVAVSPIDLLSSKGVPFIQTFTSCVVYE